MRTRARSPDARVKCWGLCQSGQCGAETVEKLGDEFGEMSPAGRSSAREPRLAATRGDLIGVRARFHVRAFI